MSDIIKRLSATLRMGIIERGSSPEEYAVASGQVKDAIGEIETLRARVVELEQQVCDQCSPDDYGWNYNAVEGRVPCVCITESGAYQELEATLARVKGLQRYSIENNGKGFGSHREIWDKDGTYVRAAELQAELDKP